MKDTLSDLFVGVVSCMVWAYTFVTYPIYALIQKPWKVRSQISKQQAHVNENVDDGVAYMCRDDPCDLQIKMRDLKLNTLPKVFQQACLEFSDNPALGTRQLLSECEETQPDGNVFKKFVMGDYHWLTFSEAYSRARSFGNGLRALQFAPRHNVMIFSETRHEFFLAAMGSFLQSCTVCTLYATLGPEGLIHGINETEVEVIICSPDLLAILKSVLPSCPKVTHVIYFSDPIRDIDLTGLGEVTAVAFDQVVAKGDDTTVEDHHPEPEDIAMIMYTSGSTGTPKGVLLSHGNITASMMQFAPVMQPNPDDIYLAYLPLAHVLELLGESMMMLYGVRMGYSTALTLTDKSSKIKNGCKGDASVLRPQYMPSVPLILDRVYKSASEATRAKGPFVEKLFNFFVDYRIKWMKDGWDTPLCNAIIFKKTRDLLGGRLRAVGCGGAPLSPETHDFTRAILGVNVSQGYGLTETSAIGTMMNNGCDFTTGHVGAVPLEGYVKLVDWEEGGYTLADKPYPRGEIVIGGGYVAVGYYKNPEATKAAFYNEHNTRWFRTGDIGEMNKYGHLKIIDRKKDLVKLQMGEYVSLGKVESILKLCPFVENVCVCADSTKNSVVAVVSVNEKSVLNFSSIYDNMEPCVDDRLFNKAVLQQLQRIGKKGNLNKFEIPTACYITTDEWNSTNKLLTATMKLKRLNIKHKYTEQIQQMYRR